MAEMIGVTRQALSSYESGRTRPDIDLLLRLSEVYETDIDGVVYGQNRALKSLRIIKTVSFFSLWCNRCLNHDKFGSPLECKPILCNTARAALSGRKDSP